MVYLFEAFRRSHDVLVTSVNDRRVEWDHQGNRGWVTRFKLKEREGGVELTVHTYLDAPPWPFRAYFENRVHPAWQLCYEKLIDGLIEQAKQNPGARAAPHGGTRGRTARRR